MERKCYAKVNLTLDSLLKRDDGYHEIDSIMVRINLFDKLIIKKNKENKFNYETNLPDICALEDNLIYKAWDLLKDRVDENGVDVTLIKIIPLAAGLAGGSTDAAEMIKGLDKLWDLGLTLDEKMSLGKRLGADIPFFFLESNARAQGIGEILTPFTNKLKMKLLLINDGTEISSAFVYKRLGDYGVIDTSEIIEKLHKGEKSAISGFRNVMEDVIFENFPHIREICSRIEDIGAEKALVSGSGASVFGVFTDDKSLEFAYDKLSGKYKFVEKVELVDD